MRRSGPRPGQIRPARKRAELVCPNCKNVFIPPLARREEQLRALLLSCATTKEIAHEMGITVGTLKVTGCRLFRKLGITNGRIELLAREIPTPQ